MSFEFNQDEEIDLDQYFKDVQINNNNSYIAEEEKALELISWLIHNEPDNPTLFQHEIKEKIKDLFSLMEDLTSEAKTIFYEQFIELCTRLLAVHKIKRIQNKVVISFGGKVSSGKSKFINSISGIKNRLPVNQKTTTAIPTYIIRGEKTSIHANTVDGRLVKLSSEALEAMAHEFDDTYGFGFSSFVDSIIIEAPDFALPFEIALLDTPGYTKYDQYSNSKLVISDRQKAFSQLSITDYLIWLIDIDNGTILEDDILFMESLNIKTPVLIVFTKADLKTSDEIKHILDVANQTIMKTSINCYGITAYSANLKEEFGYNKIEPFFELARNSNVRNNDIQREFITIENSMRILIENEIKYTESITKDLFSYISNTDRFMDIQSMVTLWSRKKQELLKLKSILKIYNDHIKVIRSKMQTYCK